MDLARLSPDVAVLAVSSAHALARTEHARSVWGRSRSAMTLRNLVIAKERLPMRMMRRVGAELEKKNNAMIEAEYEVRKRFKRAEIKMFEADAEHNHLKRELLLIEAEELCKLAKMVEGPYKGAMREVMELTRLHDAIEVQIRDKYGKFDEEIFEMEEAKYWVMRAIDQSLCDVRQSGSILIGNQALLQEIGLDPSVIQTMIQGFLRDGVNESNVSSARIEAFLGQCADKFHEASADSVKRLNLPSDIDTTHMMIEAANDR